MKKTTGFIALALVAVFLLSCEQPTSTPEPAASYKVSFDSNGGIPAVFESQTITHGEKLDPYPRPTKDKSEFAGWYEGESLYTQDTVITKNLALVAKWGGVTVSFDMNGSTSTTVESVEISFEETLGDKFPAAPTGGSGSFLGWYVNGVKFENTTKITEDVTLLAVWDGVKAAITFNPNGGTGTMTAQEITYGTKANLTTNSLARNNYDFGGWATVADGVAVYENSAEYFANSKNPVTLYAVWLSRLVFTEIKDGENVVGYSVKAGTGILSGIVEIPAAYNGKPVTEITSRGFANKTDITKVVIPSSVTVIQRGAFQGCTKLTEVELNEGLLELGNAAFSGTALGSIILPESLKIMDYNIFNGTNITTINIPKNVRDMRHFNGVTTLETVTIDAENTSFKINNHALYENNKTVGNAPNTVEHGKTLLFSLPSASGAFIVDTDTKTIFTTAFQGSNITSIDIPNGVTTIGQAAFSGCSKLQTVSIADSVTIFSSSMFRDCTSLTSFTVTKEMGEFQEVLNGCTALTNVTIENDVEIIGGSFFANCSALTAISIPPSVKEIKIAAFKNAGLTSIPDLSKVETIGIGIFEGCNITDATLTVKFSQIESLFYGVPNLATVTISNDVTSISKGMFQSCSTLTNITLPANLETIGDAVFLSTGLEQIVLPSNIKSLGGQAFAMIVSLGSITLSNNVTTIGMQVVGGDNDALATIYAEPSQKPAGWDTSAEGFGMPALSWHGLRPIVWGCTLDTDTSTYVVSVVKSATTLENAGAEAEKMLKAPYREGFTFGGWSTTSGGTTEAGGADYLRTAANVTYYAVWTAN